MGRILALLAALAATSVANPTMDVIEVTEFETAPESLQRIELGAAFAHHSLPFDIGGSQIITNAGTAVVDSGVCFDANRLLVVLDSTNTTGTFSLGDDSDHISLQLPESSDIATWDLHYPANPHWNQGGSWTPPSGASAALRQWQVYAPPPNGWVDFSTWYIDLSPTFGSYNDDAGGGIWGGVRDQDSGLSDATVRISSVYGYGTSTMSTHDFWGIYVDGYFEQKPTGPGSFVVTVECAGYIPYTYPETIELATNEQRLLDICLTRAGVADEQIRGARVVGLHQRGQRLVLNAVRPGTAAVTLYDNLGRVRMSERVRLHPGSNELALPSLTSGVYFASCRFGERTLKTKLVLY